MTHGCSPVCPTRGSDFRTTLKAARALAIAAACALVFAAPPQTWAAVPAVAGGDTHNLALAADGTVYQWGQGQLRPQTVPGLTGVTAIAAGPVHSLALKADGTVWAWGDNGRGQLGDGTQTSRTVPQLVSGALTGIRVVSIAAGRFHTLAVAADGRVWAWGADEGGQLGVADGLDHLEPVQVPGIATALAASAGDLHSAALLQDGTVLTWGDNRSGQCGRGTETPSEPVPGPVPGLGGVVAIDLGGGNSGALRGDGTAWVWGRARYEDIFLNRPLPVQLTQLANVRALSLQNFHSIAVLEDGSTWVWGVNRWGQLGTGRPEDEPLPVRVANPTDANSIGGWRTSLAVTASGGVLAAGANAEGELGDGTTSDRAVFGAVLDPTGLAPLQLGPTAPPASSDGGGGCFLRALSLP